MDPEYFRAEDQITLTPGEWQELVASIQNLVQANHSLLQTVSELMAQRSQALSPQTLAPQASSPPAPSCPPATNSPDPYDLATLNRLLMD